MNCKEKERRDGVLTGNTEESFCSQKFCYNLLAYNRIWPVTIFTEVWRGNMTMRSHLCLPSQTVLTSFSCKLTPNSPTQSTKWTHWFSCCSYFNPNHSCYSRFAQLEWPSQKLETSCSIFKSPFSLPAPKNAFIHTGANPQWQRGPWDLPCEAAVGTGASCAASK